MTYNATGSTGWYGVAVQMEDFITSTSTTPLSSVPIQFLISIFADSNPCSVIITAAPSLIPGETPPHDSCIPVPSGGTYTTGIVAYSGTVGVRSV